MHQARQCCTGGDPEDRNVTGADVDDEQAAQALQRQRAADVKSAASIVAACVCRNCRQVLSVSRFGAGRSISAAICGLICGRPVRCGYVHFRVPSCSGRLTLATSLQLTGQ